MHITKQMLEPSREDATRLTRNERIAMLWFANADTTMEELQSSLADRLKMIDDDPNRMKDLADKTDQMLQEIRLTIPIEQRMSLQNTGSDYEVRLTPKATPQVTSVVMMKEEFKQLVDIAREKCRDCTESDETCARCQLYKLLVSILPLDDYHNSLLCPYNLGEWAN